jgi:serine/threonine-protein kinase
VQYLAPEQIQGEPADPRTDLYALGVVAFELLVGSVPFSGETSMAIAYKHLRDRVPPPSRTVPSVPRSLDSFVLRATNKDREERPASAAALRRDLLEAIPSLPAATPLPELVRRLPPSAAQVEERASTVTIPRMLAPRTRRRRRITRVLTALLVLAALLAGAWAVWTYVVPHYTRVPSVLGLSVEEAERRLEAAGLDVDIGSPMTSTEYADGKVARQSVAGGLRVRTGTDVVLRVSKGLPLIEVPPLAGKTRAQAARKLAQADLKLGEVRLAFSDSIPEGKVIDQNPSAGQVIQFGSAVNVTISKGPEPVSVPNVTGLAEAEAEAVITSAGLEWAREEDFSTTVPAGTVISQTPVGGVNVQEGSSVTVVVSKGPREFKMPEVVGMERAEAEDRLDQLGLVVEVVKIPDRPGLVVVFQDPAAGTTVRAGETVTIYVA